MDVDRIFANHRTVVLDFSGGKDSLALLYLCRPYWDRLIVSWANPGATLPEMAAYMARIRKMVPTFLETRGDQPTDIADNGWPVDVFPVFTSEQARGWTRKNGIVTRPFYECCATNLWMPMRRAALSVGADAVIRGQKDSDRMRARFVDGHVEDGITFYLPLANWSDADVFSYLRALGAELPPNYAHGATASFDCWNCTAYGEHAGERFAYLKDQHPLRWVEIAPTIRAIRDEVVAQSAYLDQE